MSSINSITLCLHLHTIFFPFKSEAYPDSCRLMHAIESLRSVLITLCLHPHTTYFPFKSEAYPDSCRLMHTIESFRSTLLHCVFTHAPHFFPFKYDSYRLMHCNRISSICSITMWLHLHTTFFPFKSEAYPDSCRLMHAIESLRSTLLHCVSTHALHFLHLSLKHILTAVD